MTAVQHTSAGDGMRVLTIWDDQQGQMSVRPARNEHDRLRVRVEINSHDHASVYLDAEDEQELLRYLSRRASDQHRATVSRILNGRERREDLASRDREEFDDA